MQIAVPFTFKIRKLKNNKKLNSKAIYQIYVFVYNLELFMFLTPLGKRQLSQPNLYEY